MVGKNVLYFAVESGNLEMVKYLVKKRANVNATVDDLNILHYAAETGNLEMVKFLVERGANVYAKPHGFTVMYFAAVSGNLERWACQGVLLLNACRRSQRKPGTGQMAG